MRNKKPAESLSPKKQPAPATQDKDFIGEMAQRINAPIDVEHEKESDKKTHIDEQESDGSANAFETK